MSRKIAERFFAEIDLAGVKTIHTFLRIKRFNEPDTSSIYYRLWHDRLDITTCAPVTDTLTGELESFVFDAETELVENEWGIREPQTTEKVDPEKIDLVIVPLLCFDESGFRVGYGKGYYDRFLSRCRSDCVKVGISFFPPVSVIDDVHGGDVPIDTCITPERAYRFDPAGGYLN